METKVFRREDRVCDYLLPVRILKTWGQVENAERLLREPPFGDDQINISDGDVCRMKNGGGENAAVLLDFGKELHGGARILCSAASDGDLLLRFGESANEAAAPLGVKNAGNDHAAREFSVLLPSMSDGVWGQTGFRFLYLEARGADCELTLANVFAAFIHRDLPALGAFRCSDPLLNEIFDVAAYTCRLCMQSYVWDGVKRDRLVWIGDMHPEMLTLTAVFGDQAVFRKSLSQVKNAYPLPGWMNGMPAYSLWWLLTVRDYWFFTGDAAFLAEHAAYYKALCRQVFACVDAAGELTLPDYFIDWPNSGKPTAKEGVKALAVLALGAAAEVLAALDEAAAAGEAREKAALLKARGGDGSGSKSAAALLALAGMAAKDQTAAMLSAGGARGMSTFFSYYILSALWEAGQPSAALSLLREYYGGMLKLGATSFWEDFSVDWMENACPIDRLREPGEADIHGDRGDYCYRGFRHSLCHGWSSGPAPFLLHKVLGISLLAPGGKKVRVAPDLGDLSFAEGSCALPGGEKITVRAARQPDGSLSVEIAAPDGVEIVR